MSFHPRHAALGAAAGMTLIMAGCATAPSVSGLAAGSQVTIDGTIASINTDPWAYDGNALVLLDTATHGRVQVELPARWNLCKAVPVDVAKLAVGRRARAVGTVTDEGGVVVCERAAHRLAPAD